MPGWLWIVNSVLYCKNPEQCPSGARIHFPKEWNQAQRLSFWWAHVPIRHENGFDSTWICNHNPLTSHIQNKKYDEKSRTSRTSKVCKMLLMLFYHWHLNMEFTLIRVSHCHNLRPSFSSSCLTIYHSLVSTLSNMFLTSHSLKALISALKLFKPFVHTYLRERDTLHCIVERFGGQ